MVFRRSTWGLVLVILVTDFVTKRIVLAEQETFRRGIDLIDGLLRLTYVRNAGAAFGIFQGARWPFVLVSALAVLGLSVLLLRDGTRGPRRIAYSMILAGAAGNLIDRLFYGGLVVDFIEMSWRGHSFPVYNVADMGVSLGATLLVLTMLLEKEPVPTGEDAAGVGAADPGRGEADGPSDADRA